MLYVLKLSNFFYLKEVSIKFKKNVYELLFSLNYEKFGDRKTKNI